MKKTFHFLLLLLSAALLPAQTPVLVVPTGHSSSIISFMAAVDGKYFLTLGGDDLIKLWNEEGNEIRTIRTPDSRYSEVQLSPDNQHILATKCYSEDEAWVLDIASKKEIYTLNGHTAHLRCATYSPDGNMIATGAEDSTAILWDARDGVLLRRLSGHLDIVESVVFSPDGKLLATFSIDSTVRIWETATGQLLRILHTGRCLPNELQFSPDGKTLSVVTNGDKNTISLWSVKSGKKIRELDGYYLRFSSNGQWVCVFQEHVAYIYLSDNLDGAPVRKRKVTLPSVEERMIIDVRGGFFMPGSKNILLSAVDNALEVYDIETGRLKFSLKGYALPVTCASFSPNAEKVLVSSENDLLEWDLTRGCLAKNLQGSYGKITNAHFTPDGQKIITVTNVYTGAIWDANSGREIKPLEQVYGIWPPIEAYVNILAVSPDGQYFIRGHSYGMSDSTPFLSAWSLSDGSRVDSLSGYDSAEDAAFSPDGKLLAVATGGSLLVWDVAARKWETLAENDNSQYRSVAFFDENHLATSTYHGEVEFWDVREKKMISRDSSNRLDAYTSDITCSPDGKWIAATTGSKSIGLWRCEPNKPPQFVHFFEGHDNEVLSVEFSPDSRLLLSASQDHTVRIWDVEKKTEIATLIHLNQVDWAVTTPSGLFDASPGAMELMYFLVGNEVIELQQLKDRYYEPGLLQKILGYNLEPVRSVSSFDQIDLYPLVELSLDTLQNHLQIRLSARNGGIGKVSLFINGKEVLEEANPPQGFEKSRDTLLNIDLKKYAQYFFSDTVSTVSVRAYNRENWLKSAAHQVQYQPVFFRGKGASGAVDNAERKSNSKPALYAIVVGTSKYAGKQLDLNYAGQDAIAMAAALQQAATSLFGADSVFVQLLTTDTTDAKMLPSKANIRAAFDKVRAKPAKAEDILVVYLSGHGISYGEADKALFYYLTQDCFSDNLSDPAVRAKSSISSDELTHWINSVAPQKQVLVLDACNSGKMAELMTAIGAKSLDGSQVRAFDRMKDRTGMFLLAGSAADKQSYEAMDYGHGLLTYVLLNGMNGLKLSGDKMVDVRNLFEYAVDEVPGMSKSLPGAPTVQRPMLASPLAGSFDIGRVKNGLDMPMHQIKPVFIRNVFLNEELLTDNLHLTSELENRFRELTSRAGQSSLVYVDLPYYANGYAAKGIYSVKKAEITLRCQLFQGDTSIGKFELTGNTADINGLIDRILEKMTTLIQK